LLAGVEEPLHGIDGGAGRREKNPGLVWDGRREEKVAVREVRSGGSGAEGVRWNGWAVESVKVRSANGSREQQLLKGAACFSERISGAGTTGRLSFSHCCSLPKSIEQWGLSLAWKVLQRLKLTGLVPDILCQDAEKRVMFDRLAVSATVRVLCVY
jgi:hypothetical protein